MLRNCFSRILSGVVNRIRFFSTLVQEVFYFLSLHQILRGKKRNKTSGTGVLCLSFFLDFFYLITTLKQIWLSGNRASCRPIRSVTNYAHD